MKKLSFPKLSLKKLEAFIDDVRERCDVIDHACDNHRNRGGCGFMALTLYDILVDYAQCTIRVLGEPDELESDVGYFLESNRGESVQNLSQNGFAIDHIVLQVSVGKVTRYIDSSGVYTRKELKDKFGNCLLEGGVDSSILDELCQEADGWNDMFNRDLVPAYVAAIGTASHKNGVHYSLRVK